MDLGMYIYFEKENINSMDAKGEVMLTIMASLAQQESQSLSKNVKLGIQYRYQQGKVQEELKNEELSILVRMDKGEITAASTVWLKLCIMKTAGNI